MKYLNLGCGNRYHQDWINVDFVGKGRDVIGHNLLFGIPFDNNCFDVVYHSHVLEHFPKTAAIAFMKECFRVTKLGGIIRVAVPDLEKIILEYQRNLQRVLNAEVDAEADYDWIMLELFDQVVRNQPGGEMAKYIHRQTLSNESYVNERIGEEGRQLRRDFFENKREYVLEEKRRMKKYSFKQKFTIKLKQILFNSEIEKFNDQQGFTEIGKFRMGGEIHQWMYDKYSLTRLLKEVGFDEIIVCSVYESRISDWKGFELESKDNVIFKPDSLFIEAVKLR